MWALNLNYSNEMNRPNGHKQDNKKYRCRMRVAVMRAEAGTRVGRAAELQQEDTVAAAAAGSVPV